MNENSNPYDNSRALDTHLWSDDPVHQQTANDIWAELYPNTDINNGKRNQDKFKHLRVVLLNLYLSLAEDPEQYLGYSRNKESYHKKNMYNDLQLSYKPMIDIIGIMDGHGYIEHKMGVHALHRCSRIRQTGKLVKLLEAIGDSHLSSIYDVGKEVIILKGKKDDESGVAQYIEYVDDVDTIRYRANIDAYNAVLNSAYISLDYSSCTVPNKKRIRYSNKKTRRIFNDESFDFGGRYYGGWWQQIRSENRKQIKIDGQDTVEIDYRGFHIALLYSFNGVDYFEADENGESVSNIDPYAVDGYENDGVHRAFFKTLLLAILNSGNEALAIKAMRKKINKRKLELPQDISIKTGIKEAIKSFHTKHSNISEYFYCGVGKRLQLFESEIAETIINKFTKLGIPVLCIHDSFICSIEHRDKLASALIDSFKEFNLGLDINAAIKFE